VSLSNFSTPWTTPAQEATAVFFTFNNDSRLVSKIQEFNTRVNGEAEFQLADDLEALYGPTPISANGTSAVGKITPVPATLEKQKTGSIPQPQR
jgi:hypothetical protein